MRFQVNFKFWVFVLACMSVSELHSALGAVNDWRELLDGGGQSPSEVTFGAVEGRVVFQKRFTKVAHEECELQPCIESQAYWSVLIQSSDRTFLVNQK